MTSLGDSALQILQTLRTRLLDRERAKEEERKARFQRPVERVVGSPVVKWKPVDRTAGLVVARANWIHKPDAFEISRSPLQTENKKARKEKTMSKAGVNITTIEGGDGRRDGVQIPNSPGSHGKEVINVEGDPIRVKYDHKGEPQFSSDDMYQHLAHKAEKLPETVSPVVQRARDARAIVAELLHGIGVDMVEFEDKTKAFLEDIRQTRFSVVSETAQMTKALREVRQFFLGGDYKMEIERLREFVELCERLTILKNNGTLDAVADTMLKLAIND